MLDHIEGFYSPTDIREALLLLRKVGNRGRVVAGATDLVMQADRSTRFLVDITHLGLNYGRGNSGERTIGATTTVAALEHSPVIRTLAGGILAKAASTCGSIQNRNMATLGGNLANASPAADTAAVVLAQIAAERLGVSLDKLIVCSGDTDFTPFDVGAYASSTTIISGSAVKKASEKVREHLLRLASEMLDVPVHNLTCRDNMVVTKCECEKSVSMTDLAHFAMYKEKVQVIENASHWNTDSPPPFGAQFAEVEVDTETGHIRVVHLVTAVDLGVAINPMQAEGQSEGAVAQSLGYALTEEMALDASGRVINPSFIDYKMLGSKDMPKLTTILVETEEPLGPYGAKSISEIPINADMVGFLRTHR